MTFDMPNIKISSLSLMSSIATDINIGDRTLPSIGMYCTVAHGDCRVGKLF